MPSRPDQESAIDGTRLGCDALLGVPGPRRLVALHQTRPMVDKKQLFIKEKAMALVELTMVPPGMPVLTFSGRAG